MHVNCGYKKIFSINLEDQVDQASAVSSALSFNQCEGRRLTVQRNIRGDLSGSYTGSPVQIPCSSLTIFSSGPAPYTFAVTLTAL